MCVMKVSREAVYFLVNPISGVNRKPEKIIRWIDQIWGSSGRPYKIVKTEFRGHATEVARQAAQQGVPMVVAVGGDGTINEVGRGIVGTETLLGVVPAGSGNGFARNFQFPLNQREAIRRLLHPESASIDVGKINDHYFFNVAGIGLDATISANFERFGMRGPLPYFLVGFREFFRYKPQPLRLHLEGREGEQSLHIKPLILSIANAPQYGNGAIIAPSAHPADGVLDFCVLNPLSGFQAIRRLPMLFNGTIDKFEGMKIYKASRATIVRPGQDYIHTDGDPFLCGAELQVSVLPGQLRIAVLKSNP